MTYYVSSGTLNLTKPKPKPTQPTTVEAVLPTTQSQSLREQWAQDHDTHHDISVVNTNSARQQYALVKVDVIIL